MDRVASTLTDGDRADGTATTATRNPPLYYLYEAAVYVPFEHGDVFTRQFLMRVASIPLFLLSVLGAWLLTGEVFGRRRWLQAVTALVVAFQPLLAQVSAIVNPTR